MVSRNQSPEVFLEAVKSRITDNEWLPDHDFAVLLNLASHPVERFREAALTLLLNPPLGRDVHFYRSLLGSLRRTCRLVRELPLPLLEMLCEFIAVRRGLPEEPPLAWFLMRMVRCLPRALVNTLYEKSFPLEPFLVHLRLDSLSVPPGTAAPSLRRRWRLLRRQFLGAPANPSWAQWTFADIAGLFRGRRTRFARFVPAGSWLIRGRPLIGRQYGASSARSYLPLPRCIWGGAGPETLRYLEKLLGRQADELRAVRGLAQAVSQDTRRVILSWHNATLAAAGGWSFEELRDQFPGEAVWEAFVDRVRKRTWAFAQATEPDRQALACLWDRRQQRLAFPKILHILREDQLITAMDPSYERERQQRLAAVNDLLRLPDQLADLLHGGVDWVGSLGPHQRFTLTEVADWSRVRETCWINGLLRLAALVYEGQALLDRGLLASLVLPWIDKFFISSHREEDWEYLTTLVGWFERHHLKPLILFWEDTPHRREPSFKLVLKRLCEDGYPYRGIGVFDSQGSSRAQARAIICNEHRRTTLFALRPYSDGHNYRSFERLIARRDHGFFKEYDSSWKDGLCFLYVGTQVFPLLSIQSDLESVPAWIAQEGVRIPFGYWFRNRLRESVLGKRRREGDILSVQYATWANLC